MAKQSSFKRSREDKFLTYLILGFAGVIVALVLGLVVYNLFSNEPEYEDFDHINSFYSITSQDEDQYLVYYYSETCGYCTQIKPRILNFAASNDLGIKVYLMDAQVAYSTSFPIYDPDTNAQMTGTPSLITVVDGEIVHMAPGYLEVLDALEAMEDGTYTYLND
jgi:thiol-disulfide isomerase/thioredoxin